MTKKVFVVMMVVIATISNMTLINAEDTNSPKVVAAIAIEDIAKSEAQLRYLALSPDGKRIAWLNSSDQQICFITIADAKNECFPFAENLGRVGRFSTIAWSPDGRYVATNETFFDQFIDSDIWLFDTTTKLWSDRTDDQFFGNALKLPATAFADYLPTWNPVTGDLYMFRTPSREVTPDGYQTNFYQLPIDEGEPTLLQMFSLRVPTLSIYRPVSISPDGKKMAFLVLPNDYSANRATGLWVMNMEDVSFKQIIGLKDLQGGQPTGASEQSLLIPNTLGWVGNNSVVVFSKDAQGMGMVPQNSYYVDLEKGQATPLLDFSYLKNSADYLKTPSNSELGARAKSPRAGIVSSDGKGYIYLSNDIEAATAYVWWKALPPTDEEPTLIGTIEDFKITTAADAEPGISQDGKQVALFGYLLTIE